jgi:predicted nucleotidyltransferase
MEIAKAVGQDYKIVFITVRTLRDAGLVKISKVSNINQCTPNLSKKNAALFCFVSERFGLRNIPEKAINALRDIALSIKNPFYSLLLFGSYAKKTARSSSDIDALFIVGDHLQDKAIEAAVRKSATLNNSAISTVILTFNEFLAGLDEESVAKEAYEAHFVVSGGECFYSMISND